MQNKKTSLQPSLRFPAFSGDWEEKKLGEMATFSKGKGISKKDIVENGENLCIRYGELYTIYEELIDVIYSKTNVELKSSVLSEENDVIIPSSGETQLDIATASCVLKKGVILGGDLNIIKSNLNGVFLAYLLNNSKKLDIARLAQGNSVVHLYNKQLANLKLVIPNSKNEQEKIANFLTAIDSRIQQLRKKKSLLEQYKKGVMQQLFQLPINNSELGIKKLRFKKDDGTDFPDWEERKLGDFFTEYKKRSKNNNEYPVLTSSKKGLVLQSDYFGENRLTERDNTGFNIVPKNYITYRSRSDNRRFTFNINNLEFVGIISVYYPVFKPKNGNSKFFSEYLNFYKNHIGRFSVGTSQTVLSFNELCKIKFLIPCLEEQEKIANFLSAIDKKIALVGEQLAQSKGFKKGLLQKMFV